MLIRYTRRIVLKEKKTPLGYYNYTVILTYLGMLVGFTGITCVLDGQFHQAIFCLMFAGICDMFDGTVAATKQRSSKEKNFGIQIDSLSDLICFGALPAILVYGMNPKSTYSFFVSGMYALCALIRLAYFNVDEEERQTNTAEPRKYYQGLPVTVAALIVPAVYEIASVTKLPVGKSGMVTLAVMAVAFITPFKLRKPAFIGKICVVLCGLVELLFLLSGADL